MKKDMTVACGEGLINLRVGAIIKKDGKFIGAGGVSFYQVMPTYTIQQVKRLIL